MMKGKTFHELHKEGAFEAPARADTKNAKVPSGVMFNAHTGEGSGGGGPHRINKGLRDGVKYAPTVQHSLEKEKYDNPHRPGGEITAFDYGPIYKETWEISQLQDKWRWEYNKLFGEIDIAKRLGQEGEETEQKKAELAELKKDLLKKLKKVKLKPVKLKDVLDCDSEDKAYYMTFYDLRTGIKGDRRGAPAELTLILRKKSCNWVIKKLKEGHKIHDIIKHYAPRLSKELFKVVNIQHPKNLQAYEHPGTIGLE